MANLVTAEATALLNASSGQMSYNNPVPPVVVALLVSTSTPTTVGIEVSGGGYSRQPIYFNAGAGGTISNSGALNFTSMPSCTVVGVDEWDSGAPPVRRWFGTLLASKVVGAGDTFTIAIGSYQKNLA